MSQSEKQFENQVKKWLKEHGAWFVKTWGGGYQRNGLPDLICCYKGKFIALELKREDGKASPLQLYEIKAIKESGGVAMVLRPSEFESFKKFLLNM